MAEASDQTLLAAARSGDKDALETLLLRYQPRVYRFGMKMCGDTDDAKDVLQETLLAMARGVRDFRGASSLSTWLYTIARSFCIKKRRRSRFAPAEQQSLDTVLADEKVQLPDARPSPRMSSPGDKLRLFWRELLHRSIRCTARCSSCATSKGCRQQRSLRCWVSASTP